MLVLLVSGMGAGGALCGCSSNSNAAAPGSYSVAVKITNSDGAVQTIMAPITIQ